MIGCLAIRVRRADDSFIPDRKSSSALTGRAHPGVCHETFPEVQLRGWLTPRLDQVIELVTVPGIHVGLKGRKPGFSRFVSRIDGSARSGRANHNGKNRADKQKPAILLHQLIRPKMRTERSIRARNIECENPLAFSGIQIEPSS